MKGILTVLGMSIVMNSVVSYGADWKFFSAHQAPASNNLVAVFYDTQSIKVENGFKKVWVKLVDENELDRVQNDYVVELKPKVERLLKKGYMPPFAKANKDLNHDQVDNLVIQEVAANSTHIKSVAKTLYLLDCKKSKVKVMSNTIFDAKDAVKESNNIPSQWTDISPDSTGDSLLKAICR